MVAQYIGGAAVVIFCFNRPVNRVLRAQEQRLRDATGAVPQHG